MAIREKLRERVQPFLEPGEQVQAVFPAQTGPNPNFMFLTWLVIFWTKYVVVAATDKRASSARTTVAHKPCAGFFIQPLRNCDASCIIFVLHGSVIDLSSLNAP